MFISLKGIKTLLDHEFTIQKTNLDLQKKKEKKKSASLEQ